MAITTLDGIIAGMQPPQGFLKASATSEGAGTFYSTWKVAGLPGAGSNPPLFTAGSGYVPTNATTGAIPYTNPGAGNGYLAKIGLSGATAGTWFLVDRVWQCSGFGTVVTTAQNVTTPGSITRDANGTSLGDGVELWLEVYTAPGATGATWTVEYTNSAGTTGQTSTYTHPANAETAGQMIPIPLAAGDVGVRSVQRFQCSATSGTAGNIGITLIRRLATIPNPLIYTGMAVDPVGLGFPRIYDSSCLMWMALCSTTNTGILTGEIAYSQG